MKTGLLRRVALFIALLMLLTPMMIAAAQSASGVIVNVGRLNVREGPGVGFPAITRIDAGANVELLGRNADASWVQVSLPGGIVGWVRSTFVQANVAISSLPTVVQGTGASGSVHAFFLNVRSGPGVGFPEVGVLGRDDGVTILGRNGDGSWLNVSIPGGVTGWVNRGFIRTNVDVMTLPVTDAGQGGGGPAPTGPNATVTAGFLNVRFGPGAGFGIITRVSQGQVVALGGRSADGQWVFISIPAGASGWVNALYVRTSVPLNTLPVTG
jgi:N-acetylmuramoyl-L-alanine amidase